MNLFGFAGGDPVNFSDPFGLCFFGIDWCPPRDVHYRRNDRNKTLEEVPDGWKRRQPWETTTHQMGPGAGEHVKWTHRTGGYEDIRGPGFERVTDPMNRGSYNYGRSPLLVDHFLLDVLPWLLWGNSPDDPSTRLQRTGALLRGIGVGASAIAGSAFYAFLTILLGAK